MAHTILEHKGQRLANNREFFTTPVHEAIVLIQEIKSKENENLDNISNSSGVFYTEEYLNYFITNGWEEVSHLDVISTFNKKIVNSCKKVIDQYNDRPGYEFVTKRYQRIINFLENIKDKSVNTHGEVLDFFEIEDSPVIIVRLTIDKICAGSSIQVIGSNQIVQSKIKKILQFYEKFPNDFFWHMCRSFGFISSC